MALRGDNKVITEQWEKIKELFEAALECTPRERTAFLANLRREHPSLAGQVSGLLASYEKAGDFLQQPLVFSSDFLDDLEEPQRFSPNEVLCDRFKIIRLVGKGGMGEVYEALDQELDERVALKTLRYEVSSNEVFNARFRREIQLARKVTHPNVCRIFESLRHQAGDETVSVLSMELLQGATLDEYLKSKGRLGTEEALPLARQIIEGLSAVHAAGIIHRDLKPSNLVLVPEGEGFRVRITDFGIAGRLPENPSQPALTQASKMLGTPDYMAPEQLERGRANIQSDIYALGLVLYEMVTGAKPFTDTGAWKRLYEEPRPPRKLVSDLSEHWNKTILCCLERNPAYRFADAAAVAKGLSGDDSALQIPSKPLPIRLKRAARSKRAAIVAILAFCMALSWVVLRFYPWKPNLQDGAIVLFPEIENTTSDQQLEAVTDLMRNQLGQSPKFSLMDRSQINNELQQMGKPLGTTMDSHTARELAWRARAGLLLSGTLSRSGNGYVLNFRAEQVVAPDARSRFWDHTFTANNKQQLFAAVRSAGQWFRSLAEGLPAAKLRGDVPPENTTTSSWEALLRYSQAERLRAAGQTQKAINLLGEAVSLDSDFSLAYMRLGDLYDSLGEEKQGLENWQRALETMARRPVTQKEELRIRGLFAQDTGDFRAAEETFKTFEILYPYEYLASFYLASTLEDLGHPQEALAKMQSAEHKQPDAYPPVAHEARLNLVLGRFDDAERAIEKLRTMHHEGAADAIEVGTDMLREDFPAVLKTLNRLQASPDPFYKSKSYSLRAAFLREAGNDLAAVRTLKDGIGFDDANHLTFNEADKWIDLAYIYWRTGNNSASKAAALEAIKLEGGRIHLVKAGTIIARAGFVPGAKRLLALLNAAAPPQVSEQNRHQLQGEILLAEGNHSAALEELRRAAEMDIPAAPKEYFARALAKNGHRAEALAIYRDILKSPARIWQALDYQYPGFWSDIDQRYEAISPPGDPAVAWTRSTRERMRHFVFPTMPN